MEKEKIETVIKELKYPHPHVTPQSIHSSEVDEQGAIDVDLAYLNGEFPDGRPYQIEYWCIEEVHMATIYFSDRHIKEWTKEQLVQYLEDNGIVTWKIKEKKIQARRMKDDLQISLWAINIKLSEKNKELAQINKKLEPYAVE